jgi:hypothetical protein
MVGVLLLCVGDRRIAVLASIDGMIRGKCSIAQRSVMSPRPVSEVWMTSKSVDG